MESDIYKRKKKHRKNRNLQLEEPLKKVYERLTPVPKAAETILAELWEKGEYLDIAALHRALMELELSGYVRQSSPGYFGTSAN